VLPGHAEVGSSPSDDRNAVALWVLLTRRLLLDLISFNIFLLILLVFFDPLVVLVL
jgi:hypothetical protein